ncbi:MAG: nitroreductase [Conexibacter sp.]
MSDALRAESAKALDMSVETAIRTRRTHKVYGAEPLDRATLDELLELATWAPNHHLTNPWRFRVLGPRSLAALKQAAGPEAAAKLDRAPTLVCVSAVQAGEDSVADEEDLLAAGCAVYALLLGAHARGLAAYWRTPAVLRSDAGRAALGLPDEERAIALVHLGPLRQEKEPPERVPAGDVATYLD